MPDSHDDDKRGAESPSHRDKIIIISVVCGCIAVAALVCSIVFSMKTRKDQSLAGYAKRGAVLGLAEAARRGALAPGEQAAPAAGARSLGWRPIM